MNKFIQVVLLVMVIIIITSCNNCDDEFCITSINQEFDFEDHLFDLEFNIDLDQDDTEDVSFTYKLVSQESGYSSNSFKLVVLNEDVSIAYDTYQDTIYKCHNQTWDSYVTYNSLSNYECPAEMEIELDEIRTLHFAKIFSDPSEHLSDNQFSNSSRNLSSSSSTFPMSLEYNGSSFYYPFWWNQLDKYIFFEIGNQIGYIHITVHSNRSLFIHDIGIKNK